jgi:translation initiation factor IF-2
MSGILFKIAKEFNVATSTIVDFLISKGYSIDNKPNAKVSDEMYQDLSTEFKVSAEVKEKADKIQIGTSFKKEGSGKPVFTLPSLKKEVSKKEEEEEVKKPSPVKEEEPVIEQAQGAEVKEETPPVVPAPEEASEPKQKDEPSKEDEVIRAKSDKPGLKILGKIDLDRSKKKKKEEPKAEEKEPVKEEPKVEEKAVPEEKVEVKGEKVEEKTETPTQSSPVKDNKGGKPEVEGGEFRATTPQLTGLKILGKIDTSKFDNPQKKKEKEKEKKDKAAAEKKAKDQKTASNDSNRRKRKRKKVSVAEVGKTINRQAKGKQKKDDEVKEVSQKEIEDQIKATMARMSGGKSKRQKIRRDNRDVKRKKLKILKSQ